jgi:hypothetical protein
MQSNLEHQEVISMIQAKRDGHITSINIIDSRDFFENAIMKWKKYIYNCHGIWLEEQPYI